MPDLLHELAQAESEAWLARQKRVEEAVEEWLLSRYRHYLDPAQEPATAKALCKQYRITRGQFDHKLGSLREQIVVMDQEVQEGLLSDKEQHSMREWLAYLLEGAARAQKEKQRARTK